MLKLEGAGKQPGMDESEDIAAVQHIALIPARHHGFQYVAAHADGAINVWRSDGVAGPLHVQEALFAENQLLQ